MLEEIKRLLKHATIYGLGNVLGKVVGFVMIPFYTHYLKPADYGTLELLDLSLTLTTLILTMWLNASLVRHYNDFADRRNQNEAVSTILIFAFAVGVIVTCAGIRFARPLAALILNDSDLYRYVVLESWAFLLSTLNVVCISYLRARQRSSLVVGTGLVSLFLSLLLNIYFIAILHIGVLGVLYSNLISSVLITLPLTVQTIRQVQLRFSLQKLRGIISFGTPLIITSAAAFTLNFSDRFFLRHFSTISDVGLYALGYKFGFMLSLLVVQPFDMIWQARIYEIAKQENVGATFARLFEYYCFVLAATGLALSICIKEILSVLTTPEFHMAYRVVPVVALAYVFQGANRFFLAGAYIAKKTMPLGPVGLISASTNIGLNLLLIPRFGMMGAAWATAISFCIMSALSYAVSQRVFPIPYVFSRVTGAICLAVLIYLLSNVLALTSVSLQVVVKLTLLAAFPAVLFSVGFFNKDEVARSKGVTQAILRRYGLLRPAVPE